jgi:predicted RNA-binding Zn ribbon-like protein
MNFDTYTDCGILLAVEFTNTVPQDPVALGELLVRTQFSHVGAIDERAVADVRDLQPRLRAIFDAADAGEAARRVNALLVEARALPQLTDHDGEEWHLHYTPPGAPLGTRLMAETAMGLAGVLQLGGFDRMRRCADPTCGFVFVDASRNRSRRFCNPDTCGNRASVAAYRARRRATADVG